MKLQTTREAFGNQSWKIAQIRPEQAADLVQLANDSEASAAFATTGTLPPTVALLKHNFPKTEGLHLLTAPPKVFEALCDPNRTSTVKLREANENYLASTTDTTLKDMLPLLKECLGNWIETSYEAEQLWRDPNRSSEVKPVVKTIQAFLEVMDALLDKLKPDVSYSQTIGCVLKTADIACLAFLSVLDAVPPKPT